MGASGRTPAEIRAAFCPHIKRGVFGPRSKLLRRISVYTAPMPETPMTADSFDPYRSPSLPEGPYAGVAPSGRPGGLTTLCVLCMVLGALGLFNSLLGGRRRRRRQSVSSVGAAQRGNGHAPGNARGTTKISGRHGRGSRQILLGNRAVARRSIRGGAVAACRRNPSVVAERVGRASCSSLPVLLQRCLRFVTRFCRAWLIWR